jgi:hypothetical protein
MDKPTQVIGYARFRSTPEIVARYSVHVPGRWYPVVGRKDQGSELMPAAGMLWLDMGLIRGIPADDVEFREGPLPEQG